LEILRNREAPENRCIDRRSDAVESANVATDEESSVSSLLETAVSNGKGPRRSGVTLEERFGHWSTYFAVCTGLVLEPLEVLL